MRSQHDQKREPFSTPLTAQHLNQIFPEIMDAHGITEQDGPGGLFNFILIPAKVLDEADNLEQLAPYFQLQEPENAEEAKAQSEFLEAFCQVRFMVNYSNNNYQVFLGQETVAPTAGVALGQISGLHAGDIAPSDKAHPPQSREQQIANFMLLLRLSTMTAYNIDQDGTLKEGPIESSPEQLAHLQASAFRAAEKVWINAGGRADVLQQIRSAWMMSCITGGLASDLPEALVGHLYLQERTQLESARKEVLFAIAANNRINLWGMMPEIATHGYDFVADLKHTEQKWNVISNAPAGAFQDPQRLWDNIASRLNALVVQRFGSNLTDHTADICAVEGRMLRDPDTRIDPLVKLRNEAFELALLTRLANALVTLNPEITRADASAHSQQAHQHLAAYGKIVAEGRVKGLTHPTRPVPAGALVIGVGVIPLGGTRAQVEFLKNYQPQGPRN